MKARTAGLGRKTVDGVVGLTLGADLAAERERRVGVQEAAVGVDIANNDLDRGVVLGGNEAVYRWLSIVNRTQSTQVRTGRRALAGDVKVNEDTL